MEDNNREKVAIVPIARIPDLWYFELRNAFALEFSDKGYSIVFEPQKLKKAGSRVFLCPKRQFEQTGKKRSEYQALCELCKEAVKRGYRLELAVVGD